MSKKTVLTLACVEKKCDIHFVVTEIRGVDYF